MTDDKAIQDFLATGLPEGALRTKAWRYFVEINSACNLYCALCTKGLTDGYDHLNGIMPMDMVERIADKIKAENPTSAYILLYGNSEPMLHPKLPECIRAFGQRGLPVEIATNLNVLRRADEVVQARPSIILVSVSGFSQEIYERAHIGGNIKKVGENLRELVAAANRNGGCNIAVHYHLYDYNQHELPLMQQFASSLGIGVITNNARSISMENTIQYCRHREREEGIEPPPFKTGKDGKDYNTLLPPLDPIYLERVKHIHHNPADAKKLFAHIPIHQYCPVADTFCFIRHDGKTSLCACVADRRITVGNFLETTQEQLSEARYGHPICQECLRHRLNYYFHWTK